MSKFYFTFGQTHTHSVEGVTIDKDSVVEIEAADEGIAREKAFELFGPKWFTSYTPDRMNFEYFPRGVVYRTRA